MKGCPLTCRWCCNPEGQRVHNELKYTAEDCNGCGRCLEACPSGAIHLPKGNPIPNIDRTVCNDCLECTKVCYTGALDCFAKQYTVDALYQELARDQAYYGLDGGVTIGGGEATVHGAFTLALLRKCRQAYIHTALDTCGYITTEDGLAALEEADLVLYDIKGMDNARHLEATGVSNKIIHENLRFRDSLGKDIIIRLPIIPGYTDSAENLMATAEFLAPMKSIKRVDILPIHSYSELKYRQLGWCIPDLFSTSIPHEREEELLDLFRRYGLNAQSGG